MRFELFKERPTNALAQLGGGLWGWRLVSANGAILAHGVGYPSRSACSDAVEALREADEATPIYDSTLGFAANA